MLLTTACEVLISNAPSFIYFAKIFLNGIMNLYTPISTFVHPLECLFLFTVVAGIDVLKDLGLSKSEIRAYEFLLNEGESSAEIISKQTGIPISKIYTILNQLFSKRLINVNKLKTPNKYMLRNPKIAITELAHERKIQRIEEYKKIEESALEFAENVMDLYISKEDSISNDLLWDLSYGDSSFDRLKILLATVRKEVVFIGEIAKEIVSSPSFEEAVERGVSFRGVTSKSMITHINKHCHTPLKDLLSAGREVINTSFMIADKETLLLSLTHPFTRKLFITVDTNNEEAICDFYLYFKMTWDAALEEGKEQPPRRKEMEISI